MGFGGPLEDGQKGGPKLKAGTPDKPVTLKAGMLGITLREPDQFTGGCTIDTVAPQTPADTTGLKPGDNILAADGKPVLNQAQPLHTPRPPAEGQTVAL